MLPVFVAHGSGHTDCTPIDAYHSMAIIRCNELALPGGWSGALIAQQHLRHKSAKISFQIVFRAKLRRTWSVLTPAGAGTLRSMLAIV